MIRVSTLTVPFLFCPRNFEPATVWLIPEMGQTRIEITVMGQRQDVGITCTALRSATLRKTSTEYHP